jgi:3-methylfumaryl-CoA hydratase
MNGYDGRPEHTRSDSMAPESADRLAAVLDVARRFHPGDELPLLWHWAYFTDDTAQSGLGPDGHPLRTDDMAVRFPRRMAASGSVNRQGPLVVARPAHRSSCLVNVVEKQGRSGPLAFADWRHTVEQDGCVVLEERQSVVYRPAPQAMGTGTPAMGTGTPAMGTGRAMGAAPSPPAEPPPGAPWRSVSFDSAALFRFSAVTWNAHRIHYDQPFAVASEGYPGLVVHAPLLAMTLALDAARELGQLGHVEFRAQAPVFVDDRIEIVGRRHGGGLAVEARRLDGVIAMSLTAEART